MTKEQKDIIFLNVLIKEGQLITSVRNYGNSDYLHFIKKSVAVYYAVYQIVKGLGLETEYEEWKFNGKE